MHVAEKIEIERRFLLKWVPDQVLEMAQLRIDQRYCIEPDGSRIRVRKTTDPLKPEGSKHSYHLTRKIRVSHGVCMEDEREILASEHEALVATAKRWIRKARIVIPMPDGLKWEVDIFDRDHWSLAIAEIELPALDAKISIPGYLEDAIAMEVTGLDGLSNFSISKPVNDATIL